jgi:DNA-binding protein YbaB
MSSPILDPGGAKERMQAWKGKIDQLAADTKAMSDRFQALETTARDRDGMVIVTVDSSGSVVNLQLTQQIEGVEPQVLARAIMSTIKAAKARLADQTQEIIEDTLGTESPAARAISESVSRQLRGPDDDDDDDDGPGDEDDADELTWRN